jgi:hypothetical protein
MFIKSVIPVPQNRDSDLQKSLPFVLKAPDEPFDAYSIDRPCTMHKFEGK